MFPSLCLIFPVFLDLPSCQSLFYPSPLDFVIPPSVFLLPLIYPSHSALSCLAWFSRACLIQLFFLSFMLLFLMTSFSSPSSLYSSIISASPFYFICVTAAIIDKWTHPLLPSALPLILTVILQDIAQTVCLRRVLTHSLSLPLPPLGVYALIDTID